MNIVNIVNRNIEISPELLDFRHLFCYSYRMFTQYKINSIPRSFIFMGVKYLISILFALLPILTVHSVRYSLAALAELLVIALLSNLIALKKPVPANIFNGIFIFLFDAQMAVLFFAASYVETVMLSNLASAEDLAGNAAEYIIAVIVIAFASFLPIRPLGAGFFDRISRIGGSILAAAAVWAVTLAIVGGVYSPFVNYGILLRQEYKIYEMKRLVSQELNQKNLADLFYAEEITDSRKKDASLPEQPNIILIFTEGLSQNIVTDERDIMPNVAALEEKSLNVTGYYNHTFATYRAISGQLYSGYQLNNLDENCLISLQDILKEEGYHTAMINAEPLNEDFTGYLNALGFDEVIGDAADITSGLADSYTDGEIYQLLWDTVLELSEADEPFFTVIYTFGTHATFISDEAQFGDGSDDELNKFYNLDYQFGQFMEKFEDSSLSENTILVFTADHAAYQDSDFAGAFPSYERKSSQLDEVPLCIYYVGMEPETIDAGGRNSLDLAPTILDYLDISAENYFLGESLFSETGTDYDTIFYSEASPISTKDGAITVLGQDEAEAFETKIRQYFAAKLSDPSEDTLETLSTLTATRTTTALSDDGQLLEVTYTPSGRESYTQYWFAVWSAENAQDDLVWYYASKKANGDWTFSVPLSSHTFEGEIEIDVYGGDTEPTDRVDLITLMLP
ncbi:MAG: sulfatase-like hydrolase/transferase [Lachnospiraceae bacterium]|nr:sulfatase-like hydrolase/transferase [Lachnospiraceae bacterium]